MLCMYHTKYSPPPSTPPPSLTLARNSLYLFFVLRGNTRPQNAHCPPFDAAHPHSFPSLVPIGRDADPFPEHFAASAGIPRRMTQNWCARHFLRRQTLLGYLIEQFIFPRSQNSLIEKHNKLTILIINKIFERSEPSKSETPSIYPKCWCFRRSPTGRHHPSEGSAAIFWAGIGWIRGKSNGALYEAFHPLKGKFLFHFIFFSNLPPMEIESNDRNCDGKCDEEHGEQ